MPSPGDYSKRDEFIGACISERKNVLHSTYQDHSIALCISNSKEAGLPDNVVNHKTHADQVNGIEFVLSDATPDRMGDIINPDGWQIDAFKRNPIALFSHDQNFPIGRWEGLSV